MYNSGSGQRGSAHSRRLQSAVPKRISLEEWEANPLFGLQASFEQAAEAGVVDNDYTIAGEPVRMRFASPALRARLGASFAHLAAPAEGARSSLTINIWDSTAADASTPPRPRTDGDEAVGALYHFHRPPFRGAYQPNLETLSIYDTDMSVAWYWVADALEQPYWDQACPMRQLLFWWLHERRYLQVHGGAIGTPAGGVLLVGQPGSGKSTVALSSLGSTLLYAGDDYVAVTTDPVPRIASIYSSGKLDPPHLRAHLPHLLPVLENGHRLEKEKAVLQVQHHFPAQTTTGFPLRAILLPKVRTDIDRPRLIPAGRPAAFAALAPTTLFQLHTAGKKELAVMSRLVERVPSFHLELGPNVQAIPGVISDLLSSLALR